MSRISLLGSTGSIGQQCLDLAARLPEQIEVVGLGAGRQIELLAEQARQAAEAEVAASSNNSSESC